MLERERGGVREKDKVTRGRQRERERVIPITNNM